MKKSRLILLLAVGLLMPVLADDLEDFIQACATISANYHRAVRAKGTRFERDFQANLELMDNLARKNQTLIQKLKLGQDFDFPLIVNEIKRIYEHKKEMLGSGNSGGSKKLHPVSDSPEGLLRVLAEDVKALRKMEFTTEDGGSIKSSLETRRKLLEFRRLVDFFRKNHTGLMRKQNSDPSLQRIFEARLMRMGTLAGILMEISRKKYPNSASQYNLQQEVIQLNKCMEAWKAHVESDSRERNKSSRSSTKKSSAKSGIRKKKPESNSKKNRRMDGLDSKSMIYSEIDYSLKNINQQLIRWEQSGFQSDEPLVRGDSADSGDPAEAMQKKSANEDYESMEPKQLNALLQKRRQEILRSNSSMDGFDREAERKYLLSLPREYRRRYSSFLRDFQQQGYSSGESVRNAVLKIHTQMKMESEIPPKKELVQILRALDKDEERRLEKNDIKFKLESGRQHH